MLGPADVGKTSILYHELGIERTPGVTVFAEYKAKMYGNVKLGIYDTAGQEKYRSVAPVYYRRSDAGIFVVDCSDPASFERIDRYYQDFDLYAKENNKKMLLINKQDQSCFGGIERSLSKLTSELRFDLIYKTSVARGEGVSEAFKTLSRLLASSADDLDEQVYEEDTHRSISLIERSSAFVYDAAYKTGSCLGSGLRLFR